MRTVTSSYALVAFAILSSAACVIVRDYNEVNHRVYDTYADFLNTLFTLAGGNSNTNVFVGVAQPECSDRLETAAFRGAQRHAGGNVVSVATVPSEGFPVQLADCAEVFWYPFNTSINVPLERTIHLSHVNLTRWGSEQMLTHINFVNDFEFTIQLWWLGEKHKPTKQGILKPGERSQLTSYLGHVFSAREYITGDETDRLVDFLTVEEDIYHFKPMNRLETCEIVPGAQVFVEQEVTCDDMELRLTEFTQQVWYHKRLGLNYVQPQIVRNVTATGFENRRLPEGTHAWLKAWYESEQLRDAQTEASAGPCMNQHVSPTTITHLTTPYKDRLSAELQPILEEWYGGELFVTSIYGIRKYINGSVLRMHVDTVNTHVVSAIINVDQEVDEDWPLIILDHDDNEHRVIMKPGDMLLYESAKLLHGRPDPFVGSHYDNIFIHYKPTSGWDYSWI